MVLSLMDQFEVFLRHIWVHTNAIVDSWLYVDLHIYTQADADKKSWASFQERLARAPEQVLRWKHSHAL